MKSGFLGFLTYVSFIGHISAYSVTPPPTSTPTTTPTATPTEAPSASPTAAPSHICENYHWDPLPNPHVRGDGKANDKMGFDVAVCGNALVSGVPYDDNKASNAGKVYVHTIDMVDMEVKPIFNQLLLPSYLRHKNDYFGWSVSITTDSNTIAVGAPRDKLGGSRSGVVHIFTRLDSTGTHSYQTSLEGPNNPNNAWLGHSVSVYKHTSPWATTDSVLVAGAPGKRGGTTGMPGLVQVFRRENPNGNWAHSAKIEYAGSVNNDRFGFDVDIKGQRLVVSAPYKDNKRGEVYVYGVNYDGVPQGAPQVITSPRCDESYATCAGDQFGWSVSLSPNRQFLAIGAPYEERFNNGNRAGHVHIYRWSASQNKYVLEQTLFIPRVSDGADITPGGGRFGWSVSLENDAVAVGAFNAITLPGTRAGLVYPFYRSPGGEWIHAGAIFESSGYKTGDQFGYSVSSCDDWLAIGQPHDEYSGGGNTNTGSTYLVKREFFDGCVPTESPTASPTAVPTSSPTDSPTAAPTKSPETMNVEVPM